MNLALAGFLIVLASMVVFGVVYVNSADLSFLNQFLPSQVVSIFNLPVLFMLGFMVVSAIIVTRGVSHE